MKELNFLFILALLVLSLSIVNSRTPLKIKQTTPSAKTGLKSRLGDNKVPPQRMMDLQMQKIRKRTLSRKLHDYAKEQKELIMIREKENKDKGTSHFGFNFFDLFKDIPQKMMDFPFGTSFTQLSMHEERTPSETPGKGNNGLRRKKLQHHEENFPLFSRI